MSFDRNARSSNGRFGAIRVDIPERCSDDEFNKLLGRFNKAVDSARILETFEEKSRYVKPSLKARKREFDRLKSIKIYEKNRAEITAQVDLVSPVI